MRDAIDRIAGISVRDNRESGAKPVRTRHCDSGACGQAVITDQQKSRQSLGIPGRRTYVMMLKPGDLPFTGTGIYSGSRVIGRT